MPTYKLIYFNLEARGEWLRWIFVQAGVPYEDHRVPYRGQEWPVIKPTTPFGQLPILEVAGKQITGSVPIARYLAEEHGLAGDNTLENAQLASINDVLQDIQNHLFKINYFFEKDEAKKTARAKDFIENNASKYLDVLEKQINRNASLDGWLYGSKVTYVDLRVPRIIGVLKKINPAILDNYPGLAALNSRVLALPRIAKWIAERPEPEEDIF